VRHNFGATLLRVRARCEGGVVWWARSTLQQVCHTSAHYTSCSGCWGLAHRGLTPDTCIDCAHPWPDEMDVTFSANASTQFPHWRGHTLTNSTVPHPNRPASPVVQDDVRNSKKPHPLQIGELCFSAQPRCRTSALKADAMCTRSLAHWPTQPTTTHTDDFLLSFPSSLLVPRAASVSRALFTCLFPCTLQSVTVLAHLCL
jgi:hypothetical protein